MWKASFIPSKISRYSLLLGRNKSKGGEFLKKFCENCKDETEVVYLDKGTDYGGEYKTYECLMCQNEVRENLGKESLK